MSHISCFHNTVEFLFTFPILFQSQLAATSHISGKSFWEQNKLTVKPSACQLEYFFTFLCLYLNSCAKNVQYERDTFSSFLFLVSYLFKKIVLLQLLHKAPGEAERWMCEVRTDKGIRFLPRVDWHGYHTLHSYSHTHLSSDPALSSTSSWSIKRCGHVAYLRGR